MGIGGDLMWTELARRIHKKQNKKVCFIERDGSVRKPNVWLNNPNISFSKKDSYLIKRSDFKKLPEKMTGDKEVWNTGQHIIKSRCDFYNIQKYKIRSHIYFTVQEENYIKSIVLTLPKEFIIIEPHSKTNWINNKLYSFEKWQSIVNSLHQEIPIVQMSIPRNKVLNNVINIGSKIRNFREAALIIRYAKLFIGCEGGLMHAANALETQSIIVFCPMFNPTFTKYANTEAIWVHTKEHSNCLEKNCKKCRQLMESHDESIISNRIKLFLRPCYSGSPAFDFP